MTIVFTCGMLALALGVLGICAERKRPRLAKALAFAQISVVVTSFVAAIGI